MKDKVEELKKIKEEISRLTKEKESIEEKVESLVTYQNPDGTWTRFTKINNIKELEKGTLFRTVAVNKFTTKIETLKNPPKELKQINS